jgi:hypothetical protein
VDWCAEAVKITLPKQRAEILIVLWRSSSWVYEVCYQSEEVLRYLSGEQKVLYKSSDEPE